MDRKFEKRICIKFCYKIGKSASETLDLLKLSFRNENKPTTFRWFSRFKNGMESVKDEKRVGRPILHRNPAKMTPPRRQPVPHTKSKRLQEHVKQRLENGISMRQKSIFSTSNILRFSSSQKATEAARDICNMYGKGVTGERSSTKMVCKVQNGDLDLEDTLRSGRPSEFDEEHLKALLKENGRQTTRELAEKMKGSAVTISHHLQSIGISKKTRNLGASRAK
ncbi:hypothetical protein LAZ67_20001554 [Cordylochernes scorpioides]|uniref:Mos1 transposase HTH domain-containing protein n=1 Tax=Cordylochernes scorpioides TaxID=51811 RepID=A0ABY6LK15_9ARAC|nr:hypothetical protein LAZ67_20001554 [Cordylochernes scorpioides]